MKSSDLYVLSSPHFTLSYPDNINFIWTFSSNKYENYIIKPGRIINIEDFDTLTFGNGSSISPETLLYRYPKLLKFAPIELVIKSDSMWARFSSDHFKTLSGFYVVIERGIDMGEEKLTDLSFCFVCLIVWFFFILFR